MIVKFIGYLIGRIFVALMLLPLCYTVWLIYDASSVLISTETKEAKIEGCYYKRVRKSGSRHSSSWGPVAVTKSGITVKGDFTLAKKEWCESSIGNSVTVFINEGDPSKNHINTFFQFWFMPLIYLLVSIIIYPGLYMLRKKQRKSA